MMILKKHGKRFVKKNLLNNEQRKKYFSLWKKAVSELKNGIKKAYSIDFSEISNKDLIQVFKDFFQNLF